MLIIDYDDVDLNNLARCYEGINYVINLSNEDLNDLCEYRDKIKTWIGDDENMLRKNVDSFIKKNGRIICDGCGMHICICAPV